jgi:hypothetical protein
MAIVVGHDPPFEPADQGAWFTAAKNAEDASQEERLAGSKRSNANEAPRLLRRPHPILSGPATDDGVPKPATGRER